MNRICSTPRHRRIRQLAAGFASFAAIVAHGAVGGVTITSTEKAALQRQPAPSLASLPAPKAAGPLRILLVDDDWSGNTAPGAARPSGSDKIFRELVAAAVGGDAAAWSTEMVETNKHGPAFERLRDFNVVVWYTGESYGGGADSVATLSVEDEKTVRRYLQEVGGAFILVSPGFLTTRTYGTTWTESDNAFLKEVVGINGIASLAQRFAAGTVRAADGTSFEVEAKGVIETQFSAANSNGAAVVFGATLDPKKTAEGAVPVAVAHPFGGGRFVYVGFSFENIVASGRAKAFGLLLDAATGRPLRATQSAPAAANDSQLVTDPPRAFAVSGSAHSTFNFSASQTGPIRVQVQAQGEPITVTVYHPDGRKREHQGSGTFAIDDQVTAADLAQGHLWGAGVRATLRTTTVSPIATGTVTVSHPPGDPAAVQRQLDTFASRTTVLRQAPHVTIEALTPVALRQIATAPVTTTPARTVTVRPVDGAQTIIPGAVVEPAPSPMITATVSIMPGVIATAQFAGPEPILRFGASKGSAGDTLRIWGKDLFALNTPAKRVMDQPTSFAAEMRFVWGDREYVVPMKAWETFNGYDNAHSTETEDDTTRYQEYINGHWYVGSLGNLYERGYTLILPEIPALDDIVVSVTMKTTDGRRSKPYNFTYAPIRTTATIRLPIVNGRLVDSKLANSYSNADLSRRTIRRDSLFLGFEGDDTFYHTTQLKNGWKVAGVDLVIAEAHYGGAEITESRVGTESPYVKVHWYIITTFPSLGEVDLVDYDLVFRLTGPVGQAYF